ncbi:hypothetical protein L420_03395 [Enterobacter hormaechei subsp. hoffmannii UCICRE 9]|nr:hypothetical protein L420_03395 [Enterobacter hormaechei subsp. hoffmannii UCICRE 9]
MLWNKDGAISYAKSHAQPSSTGYCARYVTEAIRAGGRLKIPNTRLAKDMGRTLVNAGLPQHTTSLRTVQAWLMKPLYFLLFALSPLAAAENIYAPGQAALKFNQWYIAQLDQNKPPVLNPDIMNEYVASGTIAAIKEMYSGDSNDKDMPDADMFIKAQDWDDDWNQITVLHSDFDAVCTNVYVAFGKKQDHVIADCLVEEQGKWKVRSATLIK